MALPSLSIVARRPIVRGHFVVCATVASVLARGMMRASLTRVTAMASGWRSVVRFGVGAIALVACGGGSTTPPGPDTGTDSGQVASDTGAPDMGGGHDSGPQADPCAMNTDCVSCFDAMNCGWCGTTNTCRTGSDMGSTDGSCTGTNWSFGGVQAYCPDAVAFCAMDTDCASCTMDPVCGWCPGMGCLPGSGSGPIMGGHDGTCTGWAWQTMDCPMDDAGSDMDGGVVDAGGADVGTD